jgi:FolB domain-containing protein
LNDFISIRALRVPTLIGVTEEERSAPQDVEIDLTLHLDLSRAGISDDLADTVDYEGLVRNVAEFVQSSKASLIEHLAEDIATLISRNQLVERVTVTVRKPELSLPGLERGGVSVTIERTFS